MKNEIMIGAQNNNRKKPYNNNNTSERERERIIIKLLSAADDFESVSIMCNERWGEQWNEEKDIKRENDKRSNEPMILLHHFVPSIPHCILI